MARPRQNRKLRSSLSKIKQRPKSTAALRNPRGNPVIAANWDNGATMSQNYRRLGLATKLNSISGGTERRLGSRREPEEPLLIRPSPSTNQSAGEVRVERDPNTGAILRVLHDSDEEANPLNDPLRGLDSESEDARESDMEDVAGVTDVVKELRNQAALPSSRRPRQQSEREKEWISKLVEKHGGDYVRMAMDRKLNPMQQTESDMRKRVGMWRADGQRGEQ